MSALHENDAGELPLYCTHGRTLAEPCDECAAQTFDRLDAALLGSAIAVVSFLVCVLAFGGLS